MPRKVLVGQMPKEVKIGVVLTDGVDEFGVKDEHIRNGTPWFELLNITSPELEARAWFALEDLYELAFAKAPGPSRRRFGVMRGNKRYRRR
jgi:hypothetical protein